MDCLIRGLWGDRARVVVALTTDTCREAARRHGCEAGAAVALGRTCTAALLLATMTKGGERVTIQVLGKGPLGTVTADANDGGDARGYVGGTATPLPPGAGRASLGPLVGPGMVSVLRDLGLKQAYQGAITLGSGEIDEDLERYLSTSEQIHSALGCDVVVTEGGVLMAAGGVLVQCLPGGDEDTVEIARARLREGRLHAALAGGVTDLTVLATEIAGVAPTVLEVRDVRFRCHCSRERVLSALMLCGVEELEAMRREDGGAEVTCNFCGTRYGVDGEELARLTRQLPKA